MSRRKRFVPLREGKDNTQTESQVDPGLEADLPPERRFREQLERGKVFSPEDGFDAIPRPDTDLEAGGRVKPKRRAL